MNGSAAWRLCRRHAGPKGAPMPFPRRRSRLWTVAGCFIVVVAMAVIALVAVCTPGDPLRSKARRAWKDQAIAQIQRPRLMLSQTVIVLVRRRVKRRGHFVARVEFLVCFGYIVPCSNLVMIH